MSTHVRKARKRANNAARAAGEPIPFPHTKRAKVATTPWVSRREGQARRAADRRVEAQASRMIPGLIRAAREAFRRAVS